MQINTKFNIGDTCFFLHDKKVCEAHVSRLYGIVTDDYTVVIYNFIGYKTEFSERELFGTKQELLTSCYKYTEKS